MDKDVSFFVFDVFFVFNALISLFLYAFNYFYFWFYLIFRLRNMNISSLFIIFLFLVFIVFSFSRVGKAASSFPVATKPLSEPDKRLSHTYGSSINHSDSLQPHPRRPWRRPTALSPSSASYSKLASYPPSEL